MTAFPEADAEASSIEGNPMSAHPVDLGTPGIAEGTVIGDHIRILRRLGEGGMGEVYLADNLELPDKRYAIKVLHRELGTQPSFAGRLMGEAQMQSRLTDDNVVQLYDVLRWEDRLCLMMAYVEGSTLADLIGQSPGGLPEKRAIELMLDLLKGLNHAHEKGVLHLDVKPSNLLIDAAGRGRVTDFGISRSLEGSARPGEVAGTPAYMSPEQVEDPEHIDHRSDVFSAGIVFFEMLTGRLPFDEAASAVAGGRGAPYPQLVVPAADVRAFRKGVSPALARVVATALQRDRAARFQGCLEFEQAIRRYLRAQARRRTWAPLIAVLLVVGAVGSAAGYQWRRQVRAEAIGTLASTAVQQIDAYCRESARLRQRERAMDTAHQAGMSDLEAKFRRQVADMRRNLADIERGYADALGQLGGFDPAQVAEVLQARPAADAAAQRLMGVLRSDLATPGAAPVLAGRCRG